MKDRDIKQYNEVMKEKIRGMTLLNEKELVDKFNGVRLASDNEKCEYLEERHKSVNGYLLLAGFIFLFFAVFLIIINNGNISRIFGAIILAGLGCFSFFMLEDEEKLSELKQYTKLYIADCYLYEIIKIEGGDMDPDYYYAKITDMVSGYLEKEIMIDGIPEYIENNMIKALLYIEEYKREYTTMHVLYEKK